jgi:flagellar biosynthesis/type III secretory pathway protein FliH
MKQVEERYISLLTDFGFDRLFEEAEIAKFTPQEMREYETSKMAYRDIKNSVDTAKREGIAEGMEKGMKERMELGMAKGKQEGLAEGMEKGMNQRSLDIARNMLADGVDLNLIMKYSGLTQEQIEKLK